MIFFFFFASRRRHTRLTCDWSSDVCSSDLGDGDGPAGGHHPGAFDHAILDGPGHVAGHSAEAPEIADRGYAGGEVTPGVADALEGGAGLADSGLRGEIGPAVEAQVHVAVDQPWSQG